MALNIASVFLVAVLVCVSHANVIKFTIEKTIEDREAEASRLLGDLFDMMNATVNQVEKDVRRPLMGLLPATRRQDQADNGYGRLTSFSWDNCGKPSSYVTLTSVSMTPDPIPSPGKATLNAKGTLLKDLTAPIEAAVKLQKKVSFVWVTVPCESGKGSCTYSDVCTMAPKDTCPLKAGPRTISQTYDIPDEPSGDYQVTVDFSRQGTWLACVHVHFTLT